jgi:tetratricopeptide (TPR) repeat protein
MVLHKISMILALGLTASQFITGNSSLLQVYSHFKMGASGGSKFDGSITVGEHRALPIQIHFANEEGNMNVLLPDNFLANFEIRLEKDGKPVRIEELDLQWGDQMTKYVYLGEPKFSPTDFSLLEAMVGIKTSLTLRRKSGEPFDYGDYNIQVSFSEAGLRLADGAKWQGRLFAGRDRLRISEIKTLEDLKFQYALQAGDALLRNELEKALELYQRLVTLEPQDLGYHAGLAEACLRIGKYEQAVEHYEKALPIAVGPRAPSTTIPHNLALAYIAMGREDKAIEIIRQFSTADVNRIPQVLAGLKQQLRKLKK